MEERVDYDKKPVLLETGGEQVSNMAAGFEWQGWDECQEQTATAGRLAAMTDPPKLQGPRRMRL